MEKVWKTLQQNFQQFCKNNGFNKVVLGLSGGIDSALTAVLAADTLGGSNVTAIMMKTQYTSELSVRIARRIAELNLLDYHEINIQDFFDIETNIIKSIFQESPKGIVLENLQARIRGQILMAWSNQFGNLVLACGNKSEACTGYCTLYGDTCGGLMPIGRLYKTQVFALSKWRNKQSDVLPQEVIERAPSAELALNQKDENTLPPYNILDNILRLYVDERKSPEQIGSLGFDEKTVNWVVQRYRASAFKRQQMPPTLEI